MEIELVAGVPVADVERALAWYERLLGRPPDSRPSPDEAAWQLAEGGGIAITRDPERAGSATITFVVGDLKESLAALAASGFEVGPVQRRRRHYRRAVVLDPDGNRLTFAESL